MRQAAELGLRRAGDHQRVHARGLRGHHVHHHAGRVDGVAAGHVEADPLDRHPAFGDRRTGRQRGRGVGAPLVGVHGAGPLDGHLAAPRGRRRRVASSAAASSPAGTRTVAGRTPSNDSPYSRAASAPRCGDRVDDRAHLGQHRVHVDAAARQRGAQLRRATACGRAGRCGSS